VNFLGKKGDTMIQSIWVKKSNGERLDLNLRSSGEDHGLLIYNIDGLGSPIATVNGISSASYDGQRVNSSTADVRTINISLVVQGTGQKEEIARELIYRYFPIKEPIIFGVSTDSGDFYIDAITEQAELNPFAKAENYTVSLFCADPYFKDLYPRSSTLDYYSVISSFTFPFGTPPLIFGQIKDIPTIGINNSTRVSTGAEFIIDVGGTGEWPLITDITIRNSNGRQELNFSYDDMPWDPKLNDHIVIDTRFAQKGATITKDIRDTSSTTYNMFMAIDLSSDWIQILPGANYISLDAPFGLPLLTMSINWHPKREGI